MLRSLLYGNDMQKFLLKLDIDDDWLLVYYLNGWAKIKVSCFERSSHGHSIITLDIYL